MFWDFKHRIEQSVTNFRETTYEAFSRCKLFLKTLPKTSIFFLTVIILECLLIICFEGYCIGQFRTVELLKNLGIDSLPISLTLFIFACFFILYLCVEALSSKNIIEIIGLLCIHVALFIYSIVQISELAEIQKVFLSKTQSSLNPITLILNRHEAGNEGIYFILEVPKRIKPFLIALPVILGVASVMLGFLAHGMNKAYGWVIYKKIGPELRMRRRYLVYKIYVTLLKIDIYFFLGVTVQYVMVLPEDAVVEFVLTILVLPLTVLILTLSFNSVSSENMFLMMTVQFFYVCGIPYILFKIIRMYTSTQKEYYASSKQMITTFSVITLLLLLFTIAIGFACSHNFKKGLKEYCM
ncbi:conserved fungal multispanning membrane protein [Schizosaccharomyces pombe]|uniref:UPF0658 Golgi apparatus membrane protein C23H3.04 n=1 Tax=Schizosaccharomyces pombe (strain 972 / ATCC 24843) TaxID=284812 RepID=YEP4_SCHPO|nr:LOW QUALITY PROTEIN: uncharacterized protein SPAC23H3.04 [Schizosaccharomyces pombe]O13938.3 RecName: Full=UPF0658 Golgi apparatus membrane protein C23H3.04 [Schizosaccharomyces pombe 972h-]CAB16233.3 conserved fungal protein [Schizosaccharomyces pombe]|eukprot:NP_593794.2 LOW QUALITY PROTEIN: uncharacterized protein SPAC23H3.04 [Schizosaccharomyces pombe]